MRQSLKIAISLLVSLLLFAGFAVLAFSGLFNVLQTSFFLPRIEKVYQDELQRAASSIDTFHQGNLEAFTTVAGKPFIADSFATTLKDTTPRDWVDTKTQLGVLGMRLVGPGRKKDPVQHIRHGREGSRRGQGGVQELQRGRHLRSRLPASGSFRHAPDPE